MASRFSGGLNAARKKRHRKLGAHQYLRKAASFICRRFRRSTTGLPVWVRRSAENSRASLRTSPASLPLAGVSFPPVGGNGIAGAREPLLVAPKLFKCLGGKKFCAVSSRMPEWFQEAGRNKNWNFVQFEAKKPCCLGRIEPSGNNLPTEEFGLFRCRVHIAKTVITNRATAGVCDTQKSSWFDSPFGMFEPIPLRRLYVAGDSVRLPRTGLSLLKRSEERHEDVA